MGLSNIYKYFVENVGELIYYIKNTFEYFRESIMKEKKRDKKKKKEKEMDNLIFRHAYEAMAIGRFPVHNTNDRWYLRHINICRY